MGEKLQKKIEGWDGAVIAAKKLLNSLKGLLLGVIGAGACLLYAYENKDMFIKEGIKSFIHSEVVEENSENKTASEEILIRKIDSLEQVTRILRNKTAKNYNSIGILGDDIAKANEAHKKRIDSIGLHADFNTKALSIACDALKEEMDIKENSCNFEYYETNGGDNWKMFNDLYDSEILYSVDLRTNCRAYYTPIFRSKTKAN